KFPLPASIDGVFFPKPVEQILANNEANSVPFIIGVNNHECGLRLLLAMNITGFQEGMKRETAEEVLKKLPTLVGVLLTGGSTYSGQIVGHLEGASQRPSATWVFQHMGTRGQCITI
ncbi:hypothetical protein GDO78_020541, partial [Eleutherodactylus coqui]